MSSCNPYFCRSNGSWYAVPDEVRQPGRFSMPSSGPSSGPPASTSVLDRITHYAVETESAHHSAKKQYTIVPHYMHAVAGIVSGEDGSNETPQASGWLPHPSFVTNQISSRNNRAINQVLHPIKPPDSTANF